MKVNVLVYKEDEWRCVIGVYLNKVDADKEIERICSTSESRLCFRRSLKYSNCRETVHLTPEWFDLTEHEVVGTKWVRAQDEFIMLTVKQAAERLAVSQHTIYDLIEVGRLRCKRIGMGRGTIRIHPSDLDVCLADPGPRVYRHLTI
jgi:excisionase family DNA binding protein